MEIKVMKVFRVNLIRFQEGIDSLSVRLFANREDAYLYKVQLESEITNVWDEAEIVEMIIE